LNDASQHDTALPEGAFRRRRRQRQSRTAKNHVRID
jgi:hypothetical protein